MFFRSREVTAHWDTWMYLNEGNFYLYYMITEENTSGSGFGVATSPDGVTWTDHGWAIRASDKMVTYCGTGAVWKSGDYDQSRRFICNYSEWRKDNDGNETQNILFAWSEDLVHWTKYGDEFIFKIDRRWYDRYGRWDCISPLPRRDGGYYGYWTATPKQHVGIGFGQSSDGLHWEALPAPELIWNDQQIPDAMEAEDSLTAMEAGAVEKLGDTYYAMVGLPAARAIRTMIAAEPAGPFTVAAKNYGLMENSGRHNHTYFARFLRVTDGLLVNHHAITRRDNGRGSAICYFAPLKEALVDREGTLWLAYWRGNDQLKKQAVPLAFSKRHTGRVRLAGENLNTAHGIVVEGVLVLPEGEKSIETWPGLYIACDDGQGSNILVGADGVTHFGLVRGPQASVETEDRMAREWPFGQTVHFRLLLKESVLEFYLDDIYIQSYSLPTAATGLIGVIGSASEVSEVTAWTTG